MRPAAMLDRGKRQVDVVSELGVSAQTASRWYQAWATGGRQALAGAGRAGRMPRLSDDQVAQVADALKKGPKDNGFATDLWTLARVADVIKNVTGVRYSITQTWTILRERLGWSSQRPARRAVERDEQAIQACTRTEWPRIKKRPAPESRDLLSGRERVLAAAGGAGDLGAARPGPSADPPVLLEADVDGWRAGLPA
jgi:transposase